MTKKQALHIKVLTDQLEQATVNATRANSSLVDLRNELMDAINAATTEEPDSRLR